MQWALLALMVAFFGSAKAESLDNNYHKIKSSGGLTNFCISNPRITECRTAIGRWKEDELERVKSKAPYCYEKCAYDQYGFVKSSAGGAEYPMVVTKDFDGSSASRGVEFELYPIAMTTYAYEGCVGCSLKKRYPNKVEFKKNGIHLIQLPRLSRGTFYITSSARELALASAESGDEIIVKLSFNDDVEIRRISNKALLAYSTMLRALRYDEVK